MYRSIYLFDTSALDDDAVIDGAVLSIYGWAKLDNLGVTPDVAIVASLPATDTALIPADYDTLGAVAFSGVVTYAAWDIAGYNAFTLNASGLAAISKIGVSKFGSRNSNYDLADSAPGWVNSAASYLHGYTSEQGADFKPKLVITFHMVYEESCAEDLIAADAPSCTVTFNPAAINEDVMVSDLPETVKVYARIAFGSDPLDDSPVWTDVSDKVTEVHIRRGRQHQLDRMEAGTATIVLKNLDERFWPDNTSSPHSANVKTMKKINIRREYNGVAYDRFTGFIESWTPKWLDSGGFGPMMVVQAVDGLKILAKQVINHAGEAAELSGTRVGNILDTCGWPAADRSLDTGQETMQATGAMANINALAHLQSVQESELSLLYQGANGKMVFEDRSHRTSLPHDEPIEVFGDSVVEDENLITNGKFVMNIAGWTDNSGSGSAAAWSASYGGSIELDGLTAGAKADQAIATVIGTRYVIKGTAKHLDSNYIMLKVGTSLGASDLVNLSLLTEATYSASFVATGTTTYIEIWSGWDDNYADDIVVRGELPFTGIECVLDEDLVYNDVRMTRTGGAEQTSSNATSQGDYGKRSLVRTGLLNNSDIATALLTDYLVARYALPVTRIKSMTIKPLALPSTLIPLALGIDISDRLAIVLSGASLDRECFVESIAEDWVAATSEYTVKYSLSDADQYFYTPDARDETLWPNAAGDETTLNRIGGTANWDAVNEVDDATYVYKDDDGGSGDRDLYNVDNSDYSAGTINLVTVSWRCKSSKVAATQGHSYTSIKTNGTVYQSGDRYLTGSDWHDWETEYALNPQTGIAWTWAEINALQVGIKLYPPVTAGNPDGNSQCSQIKVVVNITPGW